MWEERWKGIEDKLNQGNLIIKEYRLKMNMDKMVDM